jgi:hypothetical protein
MYPLYPTIYHLSIHWKAQLDTKKAQFPQCLGRSGRTVGVWVKPQSDALGAGDTPVHKNL